MKIITNANTLNNMFYFSVDEQVWYSKAELIELRNTLDKFIKKIEKKNKK